MRGQEPSAPVVSNVLTLPVLRAHVRVNVVAEFVKQHAPEDRDPSTGEAQSPTGCTQHDAIDEELDPGIVGTVGCRVVQTERGCVAHLAAAVPTPRSLSAGECA